MGDPDDRTVEQREADEQRQREEQVRADARRARAGRDQDESTAFVRELGFGELLDD